MYDGNQVLRFETQYKKKDLYNIGTELTDRKGTGNYDKDRTKFNIEYKSISERNLYQEVFTELKKRNIEYNDKATTNFMNGVIITSGPEFFKALGMQFKNSDRLYETGKKKNEIIQVPNILSDEDIPIKVRKFFDDSYNFIKNEVGEENILVAQVHFDEDTPHMHIYFMPIVDRVMKKVYETDSNGNSITIRVKNKDGIEVTRPVVKKDELGKTIYKEVNGNFLNNDQFWKSKGGKLSYATIQDKYNSYITEKGYNLSRGKVGGHEQHKTKLENNIDELTDKLYEVSIDLDKVKELNYKELELNSNLKDVDKDIIYSPTKRKLGGYKEDDVTKLIDYAKNVDKNNKRNITDLNTKNDEILSKNNQIENLINENSKLKSGKALVEKDKIIEHQKDIIKEKNNVISNLQEQVEYFKNKVNEVKENLYEFCNKLCKAIGYLIGKKHIKDYDINYDEYEDLAEDIIHKNKKKEQENDFYR